MKDSMDGVKLKRCIVLLIVGALSFSVSYSWMKTLDAYLEKILPKEDEELTHRTIHSLIMTAAGIIIIYLVKSYVYDDAGN